MIWNICDVIMPIKQNESELEKIKTPLLFSLYAQTFELYHTENPIKIKHTVPEI